MQIWTHFRKSRQTEIIGGFHLFTGCIITKKNMYKCFVYFFWWFGMRFYSRCGNLYTVSTDFIYQNCQPYSIKWCFWNLHVKQFWIQMIFLTFWRFIVNQFINNLPTFLIFWNFFRFTNLIYLCMNFKPIYFDSFW